MAKTRYLNFTDFRNSPGPALKDVASGQTVTLTRFGRPVAELSPPQPSALRATDWKTILSCAGMLKDLTSVQRKKLDQSIKRSKTMFRKRRIHPWE